MLRKVIGNLVISKISTIEVEILPEGGAAFDGTHQRHLRDMANDVQPCFVVDIGSLQPLLPISGCLLFTELNCGIATVWFQTAQQ